MAEYLTVAEVYAMQSRLIDLFGGLHGVRDKRAVEAAVFRPQTGYYNSLQEEAAALMESLGNSHGFLDGNKRIAFSATDTFLRINGFYLDITAEEGHEFMYGSMDRHEFKFARILDWIREHIKKLA
ncbi:MAG TPA: type II toxin-antitoxin system death-on-curing family toxin [Candidatus Angelobacter sp.]|nr:type II toxin-antitoxin system death-on-curing family toxin [Candidatus Angelobacter sp.]